MKTKLTSVALAAPCLALLCATPLTLGAATIIDTVSTAEFNSPRGVAVDTAGNVYVADTWNNTIHKITPAGVVTTLAGLAQCTNGDGLPEGDYADCSGSDARFDGPSGITVDSGGNVYVADTWNHTIRKITPDGTVTTLAGRSGTHFSADGTGRDVAFYHPTAVAVDRFGNIYVADDRNHTIRKITPAGVVTTLAGLAQCTNGDGSPEGDYADGAGSVARFHGPHGLAVDASGNLYVADTMNRTIRKITPDGMVTTLAGLEGSPGSADGTGSAARFYWPHALAVDNSGNVYVTDVISHTIRKITPAGVVTTLAGLADRHGNHGSTDGTGTTARFYWPYGVATDSHGNVYVADTYNHTIRKISPAGVVTTLAGQARNRGSADGSRSRNGVGQGFVAIPVTQP